MPVYDYECKPCEMISERVLGIIELDHPQYCPTCGGQMKRLMSAPAIQMDYAGYHCPVTGNWIEGRAAHRANLKKHGCRILEAGEKELMMRRRQAEEREFDKKLEETVGREIEAMPTEKQQKLAKELEHGASAAVVRQ